jgi:hypothetical protein
MLLSVVLTLILGASPSFSGEVISADLALNAQLWKRPTGANNRLKFTKLGGTHLLEARLESIRGRDIVRRALEGGEITAEISFLLVLPESPELPFVVTQAEIYHAEFGLIAECANYDSVEGELAIGVGVCSGVVDGTQYGVSFSKPTP